MLRIIVTFQGGDIIYSRIREKKSKRKVCRRLRKGNQRSKRNQERMMSWKSKMGRLARREYQQRLKFQRSSKVLMKVSCEFRN